MTKGQALEYCYAHKAQFIIDCCAVGEDWQRLWDCLIGGIENDVIKPEELADYGMEYPDGRAVVHDHWYDVGQDTPPTRFDRALMAMRQMENKKQTTRPFYEKARQIAIKEM
jgi:hypothetical protein